jgi:hypothetical protein
VALLTTKPALRPLGAVVVKGKSVAVEIFEVLTPPVVAAVGPVPVEGGPGSR